MKTEKMRKYYKFLAYIVVVLLINLVGLTLFFRLDLTKDKLFSISDVSKEVVSTLSEPLTIHVFFTKNLPAPHNNTERYLRDLLTEYSVYGNRFFNYQFHDVNVSEGDETEEARGNREMAENYGIYPLQVQMVEKDEVKFQKAYMGIALIHGDMVEKIPAVTTTEGLEYQLTSTIQKMNDKISALLRIEGKIKVKLILSSSLDIVAPYIRVNGLGEIPAKLKTTIDKLNEKNFGKLEFIHIDPSKSPDGMKQIEAYHPLKLEWPELKEPTGKTVAAGMGVSGIVMEHGDRTLELQLIQAVNHPLFGTQYKLPDMKQLEEALDEGIENLIDINEDIGYMADGGTLPLFNTQPGQQNPEVITNFHGLVSGSYSLKPVDIKKNGLGDQFKTLVIGSPSDQLSEYALFQIDQFLMKGNSLAIFLDSFNEVMPKQSQSYYNPQQGPFYIPLNTGLEKLLSHYGVSLRKSFALDESCYRQRQDPRYGGGEQPIYFAPIILGGQVNQDLDFMRSLNQMVMVKISPLDIQQERLDEFGITAHKLISTSDKGWEMKGKINLTPYMIQPPAEDQRASAPLAYVLEGEFPSYFKGKPVPEKPAEEEPKAGDTAKKPQEPKADTSKIQQDIQVIERGKPGRIFLIGTSEVLKNSLLDKEGKSQNSIFMMNVLDYLNNRENMAVMRGKQQTMRLLDDGRSGTKNFIKWFNIIGLPFLVSLAGVLVYFRRRIRKRRIQLAFKK